MRINKKLETFLFQAGLIVLVLIGVASAMNRTFSLARGEVLMQSMRGQIPAENIEDIKKYDRTFADHRLLSLFHILSGSVFLILASLQFSPGIRMRHLEFHRWSGRLIVLMGIVMASAGLLLSAPFRFTQWYATSAVLLFGVLFLFFLIEAFVAIRRHDQIHHREWMIRAFAIAIGISVVRIAGALLFTFTRTISFPLLGLSFWIGWSTTILVAELWIRHSRKKIGWREQ